MSTTIDALDTELTEGRGILLWPKFDEGDAQCSWDKNKPAEVESARKTFVDLKAKGYLAYRVDPKSGQKGEKIKEFDPAAEKIVMVPPFQGG